MNNKEKNDISRKLRVLNHALESRNISKSCRYFGISREAFYQWKRAYAKEGEKGLINSKPCPENPKLRTPPDIEKQILYIRKSYYLGQQRISWYLKRYHGITISPSAVRNVLFRNGLNKLPKNQRTRTLASRYKRYEKQVPGHRIQVDVKFLIFKGKDGRKIKRFQYTAIDDATRIRALKGYTKHSQANAINFIDYVVKKFPFRIHTAQTDNGHEFQAKFHWHVEDLGIKHVYIRPGTPRLNGKVERSHGTDKEEFYQMLEYKTDVDLAKKIQVWENFYNYHRPHGGLKGKTPYEVLKEKLSV
jgi:transposase InsO family protein